MKKSDMDYIYNVVCPICGDKPSYVITGIRPDGGIINYNESSCGHPEVKELIVERYNEIPSRPQKTRLVKLSQIRKDGLKNDEDDDIFQIPQQ